jgi:cobalt/nickel transport system permease protein
MVAIAGSMVRYADVVTGEMRRMAIARASRGHDPRWLWQVRAVAGSAGALFIRSYERGERVYTAMLARGFSGALPEIEGLGPAPRDWLASLLPSLAAAVATALAWVIR